MHSQFSEKAAWREQMQKQRAALSKEEAERAAQAIFLCLLQQPVFISAKAAALYMPMRGEIDLTPLMEAQKSAVKQWAMPRIIPGRRMLQFHHFMLGERLQRHQFGQEEPLASAPVIVPDLVIAPLLAFDGKGARLGYGGGYYDATLAFLKQQQPALQYIGVAYAFQQVRALPNDAHDVPLDGVVTENGAQYFLQ